MSIQIKNKYLFSAILVLVLAIFTLGWYIGSKRVQVASQLAQNALKDSLQSYVVKLNDTEYNVVKVTQELITEKELRKQDILEKKELKALNLKQANEINRLKFRIDTLLEDVNHNGQIITIRDTVWKTPHNAILLPFTFDKADKWLFLKGNFDAVGNLCIDLKIDMSVDAISGIDKTTKKPVLTLKTDNPYIKTVSVASYKTDAVKPKPYGIGIQIGYGVTKESLSPYIGIGLSYNVIRF